MVGVGGADPAELVLGGKNLIGPRDRGPVELQGIAGVGHDTGSYFPGAVHNH